jgi:uncharacterized protein (TIGR02646 family)
MVKVERTAEPQSLRVNGSTWTRELKEQIELQGEFSKVAPRYKNRYKQKDVRISLEEMYGEKCCYCEGHIGVCSYEHIEHRMPKKEFTEKAFSWDNLHWSCQICNTSKDDKWNESAPILDPAVDDPLEHLEFDLQACKILPKNNSARAKTTIDHANLNRHKLVEARKRLKRRVLGLIVQAKSTTNQEVRDFIYRELERLTMNDPRNGDIAQHSMFVKKLLDDLLYFDERSSSK